ncbi:TIGR04197 family type VII secretion effector [Macrococcus capreoli]|uniref:TIGR04197 family type VII secretion effector n=1 Tax=Macrococcus capreoli TaxID=2982690 RepID=UPI003EE6BB24
MSKVKSDSTLVHSLSNSIKVGVEQCKSIKSPITDQKSTLYGNKNAHQTITELILLNQNAMEIFDEVNNNIKRLSDEFEIMDKNL